MRTPTRHDACYSRLTPPYYAGRACTCYASWREVCGPPARAASECSPRLCVCGGHATRPPAWHGLHLLYMHALYRRAHTHASSSSHASPAYECARVSTPEFCMWHAQHCAHAATAAGLCAATMEWRPSFPSLGNYLGSSSLLKKTSLVSCGPLSTANIRGSYRGL